MLLVGRGEARDLGILFAKGAQNTHTEQIFANDARYTIQILLHLFVNGCSLEHDREYDHSQNGNDNGKYPSPPCINGKCHCGSAQHDNGGAQKQAERKVDGRLHLVNVTGQASDER